MGTVYVGDPFVTLHREIRRRFDAFFINPPYGEWLSDKTLDPIAGAVLVAENMEKLFTAIKYSQEFEGNESYAVYSFIPPQFYLHVSSIARPLFEHMDKYTWVRTATKVCEFAKTSANLLSNLFTF